jgi:hypothetical protein
VLLNAGMKRAHFSDVRLHRRVLKTREVYLWSASKQKGDSTVLGTVLVPRIAGRHLAITYRKIQSEGVDCCLQRDHKNRVVIFLEVHVSGFNFSLLDNSPKPKLVFFESRGFLESA